LSYIFKAVDYAANAEGSTLRSLRSKIQTWSRNRRSSQGDYVSQWWSWQQGVTLSALKPESQNPLKSTTVRRRGSLKEESLHIKTSPHGDDEECGFVRADPIRGHQMMVKSAIISTTNPYCTGARIPKIKKKTVHYPNNDWRGESPFTSSDTTTSAPSPSPPESSSGSSSFGKDSTGNKKVLFQSYLIPKHFILGLNSLCHDQDSGYDGYCPDKSITSIGSSNVENLSTNEESHCGNSIQVFVFLKFYPWYSVSFIYFYL